MGRRPCRGRHRGHCGRPPRSAPGPAGTARASNTGKLAAARPDAFRPDLAMSLHNLAARLADLGRPEDALAAIKEATSIRRELAARWPDAHHQELKQSLQAAAWLKHNESDASRASPIRDNGPLSDLPRNQLQRADRYGDAGLPRESRYPGTVYREGRADQGFCEPHRSPTSLRHGSRSPQESHGRNGTLRYTCYTC
jgi:hypothetical protein